MKNPLNPATMSKPKQLFPPYFRVRLMLFGLLLVSLQSLHAQSKYVKKFRPMADSLSEEYGVPASLILGISILESGSCTSQNCKLLNNHFGIKGKTNLL